MKRACAAANITFTILLCCRVASDPAAVSQADVLREVKPTLRRVKPSMDSIGAALVHRHVVAQALDICSRVVVCVPLLF